MVTFAWRPFLLSSARAWPCSAWLPRALPTSIPSPCSVLGFLSIALGFGSRRHAYPSRAGAPGHRVGTSLNRAAFSYLPWTTGLEVGQMPSGLRWHI